MNANPLQPDKKPQFRDIQICQACGETATLKTHQSGTPTIIEGHRTQNCERKQEFLYSFEPAPFGIIIPKEESDVIWELQTGGLMCNHPTIRGTYIPINLPSFTTKELDYEKIPIQPRADRNRIDPLSILRQTNYANNTGENYEIEYVWHKIDCELPFTYRQATAPDGYSRSQEAWEWIEITAKNHQQTHNNTNIEALVGERVLLVYPNSD